MSVFFNGRLLTSPTTASVVNDDAMRNQNLTVGNVVALIGPSVGGKPNTKLTFATPQEAEAVLVEGELLDAVLRAFAPSSQTGGPDRVIGIRVNPADQASLDLVDGSSVEVINLVSTDYGLRNNQINVKIEAGSVSGKKLTTQFGTAYYSQDNVARNAFQVRYSGGEATARMTITGTSLVLQAPNATAVATIDLNAYPTVQALVDRINVTAGFTASVKDGNGQTAALNGLDYVTNQDVKTADYVAAANLQAVVDWFNSAGEGYVTATRVAAVGTVPANIGFTYLTGGSDGTITNTEWQDAYTTMQTIDAQWVTPVSGSAAIHAMNDAHCIFMSNVGRKERRGIVGTVVDTSDDEAIAAAKDLNSDRTSLTHIGGYDYNAAGVLTLYPPYIVAAMIAGAFAGVNPGTAMTNKSLALRGLERDLRNPVDTDVLINGGVLCVENTDKGYKVVKSISTWLTNDNYNRVEVSTGVAVDFVSRNVREAVDILRGEKGTPITLSRAVSITESTLRELARQEPSGPGVIVGDETNPAYRNIVATLEGDVLRISFECKPVISVNYVLVTIYAVPYSGSARA